MEAAPGELALTKAQTEKLGRTPVAGVKVTDKEKLAQAYLSVRPDINTIEEARIEIAEGFDRSKFIGDYVIANTLTGGPDVALDAQRAANEIEAAIEGGEGVGDSDRESILKVFPNASEEQIQTALSRPDMLEDIRARAANLE